MIMRRRKTQDTRHKTNSRVTALLLVLLWSMANGEWSSAQSVSATLRADSTQILIGDYLNVRLTVTHPANVAVRIPAVGDTLGAMEVISASKIDTASAAGSTVLSQVYTVSAYDSGECCSAHSGCWRHLGGHGSNFCF